MEKLSSAENNNGQVDHRQETVEIVTVQEFSQLVSQPNTWLSESSKCPRIQKVPPQLRLGKEQSKHVYDPMIVSLGPYHHGKPELRRAEEFKYLCVDWCARGDEKKKASFYNGIIEKIEVIRDSYAEVTIVEKYDDRALALIMLLDACIIINFIHNCINMNRNNYSDWQNCLGAGSSSFIWRDMIVMENQIPFQILKLLISLQYEKEEADEFLPRFLSRMSSKNVDQMKIPRENEEPPIHFLEACWRIVAKKKYSGPNRRVQDNGWPRLSIREQKNNETAVSYMHRSVMDLKAKGIHIRPNFSSCFMDITFSSHAFHGELQLPGHYVSDISRVVLSNLIAYEISPNNKIDLVVLSYVIFMKSLIQSPEDVKELQEKGILLNGFANLEKVVKLFKEIETFGLQHQDIFFSVKQKIEGHCNSKAKTWIANLIHTRFQTPWTAIALFAAVLFLCLTFLQTIFAIHPLKLR